MDDNAGSALGSIDIMRLMKLLPHRYPFLLVDRIIDIDGDNSAIGIKNVTVNEPHFQGHFPDQPVMPGVLIIEAMAQTAGAICIHKMAGEKPSLVYFMTIDNAKFRRPVVPGDRLELRVKKAQESRHHLALRLRGHGRWSQGGGGGDFRHADARRPSITDGKSCRQKRQSIRPPSSSPAPSSAPASTIGPFCHVGAEAVIGDRVELVSHVIDRRRHHARRRLQGLSHGGAWARAPQNTKHKGGRTTLVIGRNCTIREGVTMHRGTDTSRGETTVGDNGNFLAYTHIAHDCVVGKNVTMANLATLGGHVVIGDFVTIGGLTGVHQMCKIGHHAFLGGAAIILGDVIPYGMASGNPRFAARLEHCRNEALGPASRRDLRAPQGLPDDLRPRPPGRRKSRTCCREFAGFGRRSRHHRFLPRSRQAALSVVRRFEAADDDSVDEDD